MVDNTMDKRVIRTKRLIRNVFTELMEEKGFEGITVKELTTKADINRGTFYLHYKDKQDLLEQCEEQIINEINDILKIERQLNLEETLNYYSKYEPPPFVVKLFDYILENASFMKVMLGPNGDPSFQIRMKESLRKNMLVKIEEKFHKEQMMVPQECLLAYISSAYLGVIQYWLESGLKESPRDMALVLLKITFLGPLTVTGFPNTFKS
ncbi:DNA-binding transcriptional repressor AcrR [Sporotomaculum syntrophicum]|uniref:DNA-binding transcriptional repressor AcrR n=1 Tax=Sporotomaculum syntrophicum TaxID=182264 RepID=A0A9D2WMQ8_9FIRM|nr:TetR/AcrR family transcriptional regulator [Sporotomaculum syntrophicum]KAF1084034.1 DNA-binding transcriptional repressor AcrR [Sporotomaculum syntrophicum]